MSEVFDNYAKIALQNGLIKKAEDDKPKAKQPKITETNPRFDSLTVKDIANLYNVKPEKPESMQYEKNIIEDAHPERVILFRSHDKVNSLIENDQERQNIIINILRKMPNGNLVQKKYAESELALALVRTAIEMDNLKKDEFRILADACTIQLKKQADKNLKDYIDEFGTYFGGKVEDAKDVGGAVIGPAGITAAIIGGLVGGVPGAIVGAGAVGLISAIFKTGPVAKNVAINAQIAQQQLQDLIKQDPVDPFLQKLNSSLTHVIGTASNYSKIIDKMHTDNASSGDRQAAHNASITYKDELNKLKQLITVFMSNAHAGKYAPKESDWWAKTKSLWTSVVGDDVDDEIKDLQTLETVIDAALKSIDDVEIEVSAAVAQAPQTPAPSQSAAPAQAGTGQNPAQEESLEDYVKKQQQSEKAVLGK